MTTKELIESQTTAKEVIQRLTERGRYELYHPSFTDAAEEARRFAESNGFEIDEDAWFSQVGTGGRYTRSRPSVGKSHRFQIPLLKNGQPTRRVLEFQVYGMESGNYELNVYIS